MPGVPRQRSSLKDRPVFPDKSCLGGPFSFEGVKTLSAFESGISNIRTGFFIDVCANGLFSQAREIHAGQISYASAYGKSAEQRIQIRSLKRRASEEEIDLVRCSLSCSKKHLLSPLSRVYTC